MNKFFILSVSLFSLALNAQTTISSTTKNTSNPIVDEIVVLAFSTTLGAVVYALKSKLTPIARRCHQLPLPAKLGAGAAIMASGAFVAYTLHNKKTQQKS